MPAIAIIVMAYANTKTVFSKLCWTAPCSYGQAVCVAKKHWGNKSAQSYLSRVFLILAR